MQVGVIEGDLNTSSFRFRATEEIGKFDFVSVKSNDNWILAQVDEVTKHKDGETTATANIIGYRDNGLTRAPRHVIDPDSIVYKADQELISDTLGLSDEGLQVGNLETNEDIDIMVDPDAFYKHFAVLAQTGAGKCVTPDTDILMSDGSLSKIKDMFESSDMTIKESEDEELRMLNDCSIKAVNEEFEVVDADAVYAYRKKCGKILRIKTESGREIEVTEEHPLMVAENDYDFLEASELDEGIHVSVPRRSGFESTDNIELSKDILNKIDSENDRRQKVTEQFNQFKQIERGKSSVSEMSEELDTSKSTLENWKYYGRGPEIGQGFVIGEKMKALDVPEYVSAGLTEFLALILAEGAEQQNNSYRVIFTNNNKGLMQRFEDLSSELFDLEPSKMNENSAYIDSTSLRYFLEEIGYQPLQKSREKSIPESVMKSSRCCKRSFLQAFFDCEGSMEDHEITLSSANEEIINKISYMLLEFGIISRISSSEKQATNSDHEPDTYYQLAISGVRQMQRFSDEIGFEINRKQERLNNYLESKEGNTNVDVIPIEGEYLRKEREKIGLSQARLGEKIGVHSTLISLYERNERRPSRDKMVEMSEHLDSELYSNLADSDIFWDKIDSIEEVSHEGYVYDITVKNHHNFIAGRGGIVSHNSYTVGVLIEEMLEHDFPVLILDPHGEYSSLKKPNSENENSRSYEVKEYSPNTDINREALQLSFSSVNLDKKELTTLIPDSLTNSQMGVLYTALKRLKDKDEDYNLLDVQDAVSQEDSTAKWNLLNYLEQLEESGLFSENPVDLKGLVEPGRATVINLKAVEPEPTEMTAYMLAKKLFDLRKKNRIPPFIMVIEEAHNFTPEKGFGQAISNPIMRKIASEGRKFGLGMGVISQRPARIDKNVLSQANTQFILRVTNPNDLKAISKSFEGVTSEVQDMIKSLPPGVAFLLGNDYPVMTDVRLRKSMHGGETQTSEDYVQRTEVDVFEASESLDSVQSRYNEKFSRVYYPLYIIESNDEEIIVDGVNGEIKARREKIEGLQKEVLELLKKGKDKSDIVEELDISISKAASNIDVLEEKGILKEDGVEESILDFNLVEESVSEDELIDFEVSLEQVESQFGGKISTARYQYYRSEETVYDPILEQEI